MTPLRHRGTSAAALGRGAGPADPAAPGAPI